MGALDAATTRLSAALDRLDKLAAALAEQRAESMRQKGEILRLSQERETLLARIAELEEDGRALTGITEEVESRLDGAIEEIRAALAR